MSFRLKTILGIAFIESILLLLLIWMGLNLIRDTQEEEFVKRAGFVMMAQLAVHDKKAVDDQFVAYFPLITEMATGIPGEFY